MLGAIRHALRLAQSGKAPSCVCGSKLEMISGEERHRRYMVQTEAWRVSERLAPLLAFQDGMMLVCDLCEQRLGRDPAVIWMCERGDETIKHATSNDICVECFLKHSWGLEWCQDGADGEDELCQEGVDGEGQYRPVD